MTKTKMKGFGVRNKSKEKTTGDTKMQLTNFHTHTIYSDGNDTPREMIESAVNSGFKALGFTDHSYTHVQEDYPMTLEGEKEYRKEIRALAKEYSDRIRIYCGIEQDSKSQLPVPGDYDFILSSVHEIMYHGDFYPLDLDAPTQQKLADKVFGGDFVEMSKVYFNRLTEHIIEQKTDIVGHFDLITKYGLIPENDQRYIDAALEAIREIIKHCKVFELNTGAIARGLRTLPYPTVFMIDEIKRLGGSIIINSDCHNRFNLSCYFDESEKLLLSRGFVKNEHADLNHIVRDIEIWS